MAVLLKEIRSRGKDTQQSQSQQQQSQPHQQESQQQQQQEQAQNEEQQQQDEELQLYQQQEQFALEQQQQQVFQQQEQFALQQQQQQQQQPPSSFGTPQQGAWHDDEESWGRDDASDQLMSTNSHEQGVWMSVCVPPLCVGFAICKHQAISFMLQLTHTHKHNTVAPKEQPSMQASSVLLGSPASGMTPRMHTEGDLPPLQRPTLMSTALLLKKMEALSMVGVRACAYECLICPSNRASHFEQSLAHDDDSN